MKARDIIPGWPRGRSTSSPYQQMSSVASESFPPDTCTAEYRTKQREMTDHYRNIKGWTFLIPKEQLERLDHWLRNDENYAMLVYNAIVDEKDPLRRYLNRARAEILASMPIWDR